MKTSPTRHGKPGYISYVLVISTSLVLTLITFYAYKEAINAKEIQADIQLKVDYTEKEDAILRSIVAITPNRAMRAMMADSNSNTAVRNTLRWRDIFDEALDMANARTSIPGELLQSVSGKPNILTANVGDGNFADPSVVFHPIEDDNDGQEGSFVSAGINQSMGQGFPAPLQTANLDINDLDSIFPIISHDKQYGSLAEGQVGLATASYPTFNLIPYPDINFGYASPGQPFVAKRNWWAFELDLANADAAATQFHRPRRKFVLSIYEIPSQLSISASSFMALGRHGDGAAWDENVSIAGKVFAGRAEVDGPVALEGLSSRRKMEFSDSTASIGGQNFLSNPFEAGMRENYQITTGESYPVSLASESGRVSFIPINRGAAFFDWYAHPEEENDSISPTTWNQYSVGAKQCAMRLDIIEVDANTVPPTPTRLRFEAKPGIVKEYDVNVTNPDPSLPFYVTRGHAERICIAIKPEAFPAYLQSLGASDTSQNHSLVVNIDYTKPNLSNPIGPDGNYIDELGTNPDGSSIWNYGLIITDCTNLTAFTKGFSVVSNLRVYIGDDFNMEPYPDNLVPDGVTKPFYPPVSLFVPEKRFGVEEDPYQITLSGQIGSLASENAENSVKPLDAKTVSNNQIMSAENVEVNLTPITHPAALPPITMMNWLVMVEELRAEHMAEYSQAPTGP